MLAALIDSALVNNTSLENARLNVEVARANLKGARLAYLPSVAIAPNGAGASYAGHSTAVPRDSSSCWRTATIE